MNPGVSNCKRRKVGRNRRFQRKMTDTYKCSPTDQDSLDRLRED
jgi:hypothetical protein